MSWTIPGQGYLKMWNEAGDLQEAVTIEWKETNRDNPQTFETTHKGQKITLDWFKGNSMKKGGTMHVKGNGAPAKEVAQAVAKQFAGQRIITLNGKVFSTKVAGFKDRSPDDYTTYRPGWKKDWTFTV